MVSFVNFLFLLSHFWRVKLTSTAVNVDALLPHVAMPVSVVEAGTFAA